MSILMMFLKYLGYCWLGMFILLVVTFTINSYLSYRRKRDIQCINCDKYDNDTDIECKGCKYLKDRERLNNISYHHHKATK